MIGWQQKCFNGENQLLIDRFYEWKWISTNSEKQVSGFEHFFEWNNGQFYTNLLPKLTFVKTSLLCPFWLHLWSQLLDSMNLPSDLFRLFSNNISETGIFPHFPQDFFSLFHSWSALNLLPNCVFHSARVFLKDSCWKAYDGRVCSQFSLLL